MIVKIASVEIVGEDGQKSIIPSIPFSEFPHGRREARPDEDDDGRLAWFVEVSD